MCVRVFFLLPARRVAEDEKASGLLAGAPVVWLWRREGILAGHSGLAFWRKPPSFHLYIEAEGTEHRTQ